MTFAWVISEPRPPFVVGNMTKVTAAHIDGILPVHGAARDSDARPCLLGRHPGAQRAARARDALRPEQLAERLPQPKHHCRPNDRSAGSPR